MYSIKNMNLNNVKKDVSFKPTVNENYTTSALSMMLQMHESHNESLSKMALDIVSGTPINEAVSIYLNSNLIIMDKILDSINMMISNFSKELVKINKDRKYFIERVNQIKDRTDEIGNSALTLKGNLYTELKQPNILLASEFKLGFSELLSKNPSDVFNKIMSYYESGNYLDTIRKETLQHSSNISDKVFRDKIFGYYRNNIISESTVVYKQAQIANAVRKYLDFDVYIDNLNELRDDIQSQIKEVKRCIEIVSKECTLSDINNLVYGNTSKGTSTDNYVPFGLNDVIKTITKKKVSFIIEFMNMYLLLVSDKISAMRASINQDAVLLDTFYNYLLSEGGEQ